MSQVEGLDAAREQGLELTAVRLCVIVEVVLTGLVWAIKVLTDSIKLSRAGLRASAPAVDTASKPRYAKKIVAAAVIRPPTP